MVKAEKRADLESCQLLGIDHTRSMAKFWKTMDKIEAANDINLADYPTLYKLLTMHPPHSERSAYLTTLAEKMETV